MDQSKFNEKREWKKFGIGLAVILAVLGLVLWYKDKPVYIYFEGLAVLSILSALLFPMLLKPVFIGFSYFGFGMNWMMTRIILAIVFYLLLTPINLISRLLGKKYLITALEKEKVSYWEPVAEERHDPVNYERQF